MPDHFAGRHAYWPKVRAFTDPVLEAVADLGVPVLIHTDDPPFAVPALMEPLAADHPDTTVILAHLGTQKTGYADDAINVARHCDNIYLETGWGHQPRVAEAVMEIGASRMVFGSDCPVQDPFSQPPYHRDAHPRWSARREPQQRRYGGDHG